MEVPMPRQYWRWLYDSVCTVRDTASPRSYTLVCDEMHVMDFRILVPHDGNRASDGVDLRDEFLNSIRNKSLNRHFERIAHNPSIFEVLVSLTDHAKHMTGMSQEEWFAIFLRNLGLERLNDQHATTGASLRIRRNLRRFNNRTYFANGKGGLFPLSRPLRDQRQVELWYQMGAYINENQLY